MWENYFQVKVAGSIHSLRTSSVEFACSHCACMGSPTFSGSPKTWVWLRSEWTVGVSVSANGSFSLSLWSGAIKWRGCVIVQRQRGEAPADSCTLNLRMNVLNMDVTCSRNTYCIINNRNLTNILKCYLKLLLQLTIISDVVYSVEKLFNYSINHNIFFKSFILAYPYNVKYKNAISSGSTWASKTMLALLLAFLMSINV